MKTRTSFSKTILIFSIVVIIFLTSCTASKFTSDASSSTSTSGEQLDGKTLMENRCTACHTTTRITSKHATVEEWTITIDRMIGKGAQMTIDEKHILADYLYQTYP